MLPALGHNSRKEEFCGKKDNILQNSAGFKELLWLLGGFVFT
jgi:hypothetical protein